MTGSSLEAAFVSICLAIVVAAGAAALAWMSFVRPRVGLYAILALTPTQFIFIPVSNFFLSPEDVLVMAGAAGLAVRLAQGNPRTLDALRLHVFLGVMVASYLIG